MCCSRWEHFPFNHLYQCLMWDVGVSGDHLESKGLWRYGFLPGLSYRSAGCILALHVLPPSCARAYSSTRSRDASRVFPVESLANPVVFAKLTRRTLFVIRGVQQFEQLRQCHEQGRILGNNTRCDATGVESYVVVAPDESVRPDSGINRAVRAT